MPTGNLPAEGKKLWERVYEGAKKSSTCKGSDNVDQCAARVAWTAVKNAGWRKDAQGNWHKSSMTEFSMRIERASYDKASNERRWRAVASDTDEDSRKDSMSLQLFNDFLSRIDSGEVVPEDYQSDFWKGGMPYVSVSHYPDLNGAGVPGIIDAIYTDGTYLKAKGRFNDTELGRKCFEAICSDLYSKESEQDKKVRVSIGFLDWSHQHKSNGYTFKRDGEYDFCPQCLKELLTGEDAGKVFLSGHLVHLALTRVPANKRTTMEVEKSMAEEILTRKDDATSIVGEELATELEEKTKKTLEQDSLVTFSEVPETTEDNTVSTPVSGTNPDVVQEMAEVKNKGKKAASDEVPLDESDDDEDDLQQQEGKCKDKKKSEVDLSEVLASIHELKSILEAPPHPLDAIFEVFKSEFDVVSQSDAEVDEKLRSIQEPFNTLGSNIVATIKSTIVVKSEQDATEDDMETLIAKAVAKAVTPLNEKLEMLSTNMRPVSAETLVPQRRNISVEVIQKAQTVPQVSSKTPKLRALINKTVG